MSLRFVIRVGPSVEGRRGETRSGVHGVGLTRPHASVASERSRVGPSGQWTGQDRQMSSGSARPGEGTGRDPAAESGIWSLACGEYRRGCRRRGLSKDRLTVELVMSSLAGLSWRL